MDLPLTQALDLRDPEVAHEIDNYGMHWNWPHFPMDTAYFIATGIRPRRSRKVTMRLTVRVSDELKSAMKEIEESVRTWVVNNAINLNPGDVVRVSRKEW